MLTMNQTMSQAPLPPIATGIIALLATTVSTATLGGNLVVLTAFLVESSLRIPSNYFIASLAVTDVLIGLFSMNLFITYQLLGYWPLGEVVCDFWLSLDFSACLTSQYTVFLITLDRFCSVKIPVSYRNWRTLTKVRILICASWLIPALLFVPVIFGWRKITGERPRRPGKCDVSFVYYPIFNTSLIIGYFWTTLVVMCSLYAGIYQVARRLELKSQALNKKFSQFFANLDDPQCGAEMNSGRHRPTENEKGTNSRTSHVGFDTATASWHDGDRSQDKQQIDLDKQKSTGGDTSDDTRMDVILVEGGLCRKKSENPTQLPSHTEEPQADSSWYIRSHNAHLLINPHQNSNTMLFYANQNVPRYPIWD